MLQEHSNMAIIIHFLFFFASPSTLYSNFYVFMNQTQFQQSSVGFSHLATRLAAAGKWPASGNVIVLQVELLIAYHPYNHPK